MVFLSGVTSNGPKSLLIRSDLLLYATCIGVENKGADFFSFIRCLLVTGSFFSGWRRTSEQEAGRNDTVLLEVIPISVDKDSSELAVSETLPLVYSKFEDRLDLLELVSIAFPKPLWIAFEVEFKISFLLILGPIRWWAKLTESFTCNWMSWGLVRNTVLCTGRPFWRDGLRNTGSRVYVSF